MPDTGEPYPALLTFFTGRFPKISEQIWVERITTGKVLTEKGDPVTLDTAYMPNSRLFYFREVTEEPVIPFQEEILFTSDHLMVVCKPHFLPVNPGGPYVRETLLNRLKEKTGNTSLSPINRIDRATAGLVLISTNEATRGLYQQLFMQGLVRKTYEAVADFSHDSGRERMAGGKPDRAGRAMVSDANLRRGNQRQVTDSAARNNRITGPFSAFPANREKAPAAHPSQRAWLSHCQ